MCLAIRTCLVSSCLRYLFSRFFQYLKFSIIYIDLNIIVVHGTYLLEMTTVAPREDKSCVIPLPSPVPPPVMKALLPSRQLGGRSGIFTAGNISAAPLL